MPFQIFQREFLRIRGGGRGERGKIDFEKEGKSLNAVSRPQQVGGIEITINLFGFWVKVRTVQTTMIGKHCNSRHIFIEARNNS